MCVSSGLFLSLVLKPPGFNHGSCTLLALSNPNHLPEAPPLNPIVSQVSIPVYLVLMIELQHRNPWGTLSLHTRNTAEGDQRVAASICNMKQEVSTQSCSRSCRTQPFCPQPHCALPPPRQEPSCLAAASPVLFSFHYSCPCMTS